MLAKLTRWYTPAEALMMATSTNAELLALSGLRNPYPGKLGVVEEGALADLLLVDGNPLENIELDRRPGEELRRHHEGREDLQESRREGQAELGSVGIHREFITAAARWIMEAKL